MAVDSGRPIYIFNLLPRYQSAYQARLFATCDCASPSPLPIPLQSSVNRAVSSRGYRYESIDGAFPVRRSEFLLLVN